MGNRFASRGLAALALAAVLVVPHGAAIHGFIPPPPDFPDLTFGSGLDHPTHKWDPSLGEPGSLLDVLPAGSPAAGDFNRDGYADLFIPSSSYADEALAGLRGPASKLYMNDGSNRVRHAPITAKLVDVTDVAGIDVRGFAYAASWGDANGDGFLDLVVGGYRMARLFLNNQDSTFTEATAAWGLPQDGLVLGAAWGDHDRDGDLDLLLVQFAAYEHPGDGLPDLRDLPGKANVLLRNDGGAFTDVTLAAGLAGVARRSTSAVFVDANLDRRPDLYVTNFGQPAELWVNQGDGTFAEGAAAAGLADGHDATCQAWEDLDRDGLLDLFVAHQAGVRDGLWLANGDGTFRDISGMAGLEATEAGDAWGCAAFDYDADGDIDLYTAQGGLRGQPQADVLLMNKVNEHGGIGWVDATAEAGNNNYTKDATPTIATPRATNGAAVFDLNLEAGPDIVAQVTGGGATLFVNAGSYVWTGNGNHFKAQLRGTASNAPGVGAKVTVSAGNISVTRVVGTSMGWGGFSLPELGFGFSGYQDAGYTSGPDARVRIEWPSGLVETYDNLFRIEAFVRFTEGRGAQADVIPPHPKFLLVSGEIGQNGWYTSPTVQLRLKADELNGIHAGNTEATGIRSLRYSTDGTTWKQVTSLTSGATLTFSGDGTHKVWVEAVDKAGDRPGWTDNRAVYLYPIRIDAQAPAGDLDRPRHGGVYVQDREAAHLDAIAGPLGRAVVLAPVAEDFAALGEPGAVLRASAGDEGSLTLAASASDATSGVWKVGFTLRNHTTHKVAEATLRVPPYVAAWDTSKVPAGEYVLGTTITDMAGNTRATSHKLLLLPSGPDAAVATAELGPSLPQV